MRLLGKALTFDDGFGASWSPGVSPRTQPTSRPLFSRNYRLALAAGLAAMTPCPRLAWRRALQRAGNRHRSTKPHSEACRRA